MKFKNNISLKAGLSYAIVAIAMILIIALVYVNTRSLNAISTSVGEYARMQQHADSALAGMMADERESLQQLNEAMALSRRPGALRRRMDSLNSGKDSVVVHSKATETHHCQHNHSRGGPLTPWFFPPPCRPLSLLTFRHRQRAARQHLGWC